MLVFAIVALVVVCCIVLLYTRSKKHNVVVVVPATASAPARVYTMTASSDSVGNDINHVTGQSVASLQALCDTTPGCVAFNTDGWLKNKINPAAQWQTGKPAGFATYTLNGVNY